MIATLRGPVPSAVATLLLCASMAACVGPTELVEVVTWEGEVMPVPGFEGDVTASVAMVANEFSTQMGIGARGDVPGALGWSVHTGSCAQPGERVGPASMYPALDLAGDGTADASTLLNRRVEVAVPYVALIRTGASESGAVVACGVLHRND